MLAHAVRRIAAAVPVMLLVALMVFSLLYLAPGDPAAIIAGDQATPAEIERIRISLGLDKSFVVRFVDWLGHVARGDLGTSIFTSLPVTLMIGQRVEPTLVLLVMTLIFSVGIAVPLGAIAAWKQGTWIDQLLMVGAVLGFSIPVFVVGYLLAYIFALRLSWVPVQGYAPLAEGLWACMRSVLLPAIALGTVYAALIARVTRAAMLEVLSQDYVRTAKAKGVGQPTILFLHSLKNAAIPIMTVIGIGVALLIGGSVVTESVFAIPGIGRLVVDAILRRDYPVIQESCCSSASPTSWSTWALTCCTRCSIRGCDIEHFRYQEHSGAARIGRRAAARSAAWQDHDVHPSLSDDRRRWIAVGTDRADGDLGAVPRHQGSDCVVSRPASEGAIRPLLVRH